MIWLYSKSKNAENPEEKNDKSPEKSKLNGSIERLPF